MISHFQPHGSAACRVPCVLESAQDCFENASHAALRKLTCEFARGVLILRGKVPSYYEKQLAQEAVRKIDGVRQIVNEIEVLAAADWPEH